MIGVVKCSEADVLAEPIEGDETEEEPAFARTNVDPKTLYKPSSSYVWYYILKLLKCANNALYSEFSVENSEAGRPKPSKGFFSNLLEHVLGGS